MSTNKKRKRAPGAGRKPKGGRFVGNTERFNIRCTPEIKDRLEIAAAKNGRSLSQEIQERLERTFNEDAENVRDSAMAGLLWMVERAAVQFVRGGKRSLPGWRSDPAEFEGLKAAIGNILERLRPVGGPIGVSDEPNSPLNRAKYVEWLLFDTVPQPKPIRDHYKRGALGKLSNFPLGSDTARNHQDFMDQEAARLAALKALGLK
jgi:hypothetical protein